MQIPWWAWAITFIAVIGSIVIDMWLNRKPHSISTREAAWSTIVWTALGLGFGLIVWLEVGSKGAGEYFAGYMLERALSIDNVFVFVIILSYFAVPRQLQHRALMWGIIGALVMRGLFIAVGVAALERFHWMIYVFGVLLLVTAQKLLRSGDDDEVDPSRNPMLKLLRRFTPITNDFHGNKMFVKTENGKRRVATPMLAVLVVLGTTDVVFALDSIPAVFAVTREPFIVFSSNAFAVLGLLAMSFLLASMMDRFVYIKPALAIILGLVAIKMLLSSVIEINAWYALGAVGIVLAGGILLSLLKTRDIPTDAPSPLET